MKKIERILAMIVLLLENETISTTRLAERFAVSKRTIFRDIETIELAGFPIVATTGRNGGFSLLQSFKLRTLTYSEDDKQTILAALESTEELFGKAHVETDSLIKEKISLLQVSQAGGATTSMKSPTVHRPEIEEESQRKMRLIKSALTNDYRLLISYVGNKGEFTERCIQPYELTLQNGSWYVYGFCETRQDFRYFKVTRIRQLTVDNRHFEKEEVTKSWWSSPELPIVLRFKREDLGKLYDYYTESEIEINEDHLIVSAISQNQHTLLTQLLVFGNGVQVMAPQELKEQHQQVIKELAMTYKD